jgi:copper chaperone CopZ
MTIENGLKQLPGVTEVSVDLSKKAVGIDGDVRLEDVRKAITEMGFTPEEKEES